MSTDREDLKAVVDKHMSRLKAQTLSQVEALGLPQEKAVKRNIARLIEDAWTGVRRGVKDLLERCRAERS